jgi:hypothetical protein
MEVPLCNCSRGQLRQLGEEHRTVDQKWRREKALMVGLAGKEREVRETMIEHR